MTGYVLLWVFLQGSGSATFSDLSACEQARKWMAESVSREDIKREADFLRHSRCFSQENMMPEAEGKRK